MRGWISRLLVGVCLLMVLQAPVGAGAFFGLGDGSFGIMTAHGPVRSW